VKGRTSPFLLACGEEQIFVMLNEKETFFELSKPFRAFDALLSLIAMYYAFDFAYPKEVKSTFLFIQEFVLYDLMRVNTRHTRYVTQLNKYLSFVSSLQQ